MQIFSMAINVSNWNTQSIKGNKFDKCYPWHLHRVLQTDTIIIKYVFKVFQTKLSKTKKSFTKKAHDMREIERMWKVKLDETIM